MQISRAYQSRLLDGMRVAYCGTEGAFAHIASRKLFPDAKHIAFSDFEGAYLAVANGECEKGIVICTTGIGISMAANKHKGIRCALCSEPLSAKMTRLHNDANMLAMGAGMIGENLAYDIVETFIGTEFSGEERHQRRIDLIEE